MSSAYCVSVVLIVPLWNWNMVDENGLDLPELGSNRTFMELKWKLTPKIIV